MESSRYRKASEAFDACNSEIKELEEAAGITSRELGTLGITKKGFERSISRLRILTPYARSLYQRIVSHIGYL